MDQSLAVVMVPNGTRIMVPHEAGVDSFGTVSERKFAYGNHTFRDVFQLTGNDRKSLNSVRSQAEQLKKIPQKHNSHQVLNPIVSQESPGPSPYTQP
jgi:hypothetical protein